MGNNDEISSEKENPPVEPIKEILKSIKWLMEHKSLLNETAYRPKDEWKDHVWKLSILGDPEQSAAKIDYRKYLELIRLLEEKIGEITFVSAIKELEGDHRDKYLAYFFSRISDHEIGSAIPILSS